MRKIIAVMAILFLSPLAGQQTVEDSRPSSTAKTEQTVINVDVDVQSITIVMQEDAQDAAKSREVVPKHDTDEQAGQPVRPRKPLILATMILAAILLLGIVLYRSA